jgi:hypothetical protein
MGEKRGMGFVYTVSGQISSEETLKGVSAGGRRFEQQFSDAAHSSSHKEEGRKHGDSPCQLARERIAAISFPTSRLTWRVSVGWKGRMRGRMVLMVGAGGCGGMALFEGLCSDFSAAKY